LYTFWALAVMVSSRRSTSVCRLSLCAPSGLRIEGPIDALNELSIRTPGLDQLVLQHLQRAEDTIGPVIFQLLLGPQGGPFDQFDRPPDFRDPAMQYVRRDRSGLGSMTQSGAPTLERFVV
jgi:hypothetical protein